jgi:hypothetical protein
VDDERAHRHLGEFDLIIRAGYPFVFDSAKVLDEYSAQLG